MDANVQVNLNLTVPGAEFVQAISDKVSDMLKLEMLEQDEEFGVIDSEA